MIQSQGPDRDPVADPGRGSGRGSPQRPSGSQGPDPVADPGRGRLPRGMHRCRAGKTRPLTPHSSLVTSESTYPTRGLQLALKPPPRSQPGPLHQSTCPTHVRQLPEVNARKLGHRATQHIVVIVFFQAPACRGVALSPPAALLCPTGGPTSEFKGARGALRYSVMLRSDVKE
jgi:hypothetical protein